MKDSHGREKIFHSQNHYLDTPYYPIDYCKIYVPEVVVALMKGVELDYEN
jgi:hypothetical protein